jgi:hypothetical protein
MRRGGGQRPPPAHARATTTQRKSGTSPRARSGNGVRGSRFGVPKEKLGGRESFPSAKLGLEGIVSKCLGSRYRSGRSKDWLKFKHPAAPAVKREAEEDWGR